MDTTGQKQYTIKNKRGRRLRATNYIFAIWMYCASDLSEYMT